MSDGAVEDAVRERLEADPEDRPTSLYAWAVEERGQLWGDLENAMRDALNGHWSIQCENIVQRLVEVTLLVGPEPWSWVQIPLLERGVWQEFHAALGVDVEQPDMARVAELRAWPS